MRISDCSSDVCSSDLVVLYDEQVGPEIVDYARRDAQRVYIGRSTARHALSQDEINGLMDEQAVAGRRIVRRPGGDPFNSGGGGGALDYLQRRAAAAEAVTGGADHTGCPAQTPQSGERPVGKQGVSAGRTGG